MTENDKIETVSSALRSLYPQPDHVDLDISVVVAGRARRRNLPVLAIAACVVTVVVLAIVLTHLATSPRSAGPGSNTAPAVGPSTHSGAASTSAYATFDLIDSAGNTFTETIQNPPVMTVTVKPSKNPVGEPTVFESITASRGSITNTTPGKTVPSPTPINLYGYWPSASPVCDYENGIVDGGDDSPFKQPAGDYCSLQLTAFQYTGVTYVNGDLPAGTTLSSGASADFTCVCTGSSDGTIGSVPTATAPGLVAAFQSGPSFILAGPSDPSFELDVPGHHAKPNPNCPYNPDTNSARGYYWASQTVIC